MTTTAGTIPLFRNDDNDDLGVFYAQYRRWDGTPNGTAVFQGVIWYPLTAEDPATGILTFTRQSVHSFSSTGQTGGAAFVPSESAFLSAAPATLELRPDPVTGQFVPCRAFPSLLEFGLIAEYRTSNVQGTFFGAMRSFRADGMTGEPSTIIDNSESVTAHAVSSPSIGGSQPGPAFCTTFGGSGGGLDPEYEDYEQPTTPPGYAWTPLSLEWLAFDGPSSVVGFDTPELVDELEAVDIDVDGVTSPADAAGTRWDDLVRVDSLDGVLTPPTVTNTAPVFTFGSSIPVLGDVSFDLDFNELDPYITTLRIFLNASVVVWCLTILFKHVRGL